MGDLPTDGWFALQTSIQYRKIVLYSLTWPNDINLNHMNVAAAPFGGPIATVRNARKITEVGGASSKPMIRIFTASGNILASIEWNSGALLTLGWSDAEHLLCVQDDGVILIYDMFGNYRHTFGMGKEAKDTKVNSAKIFMSSAGTGVAVMTTNYRIFLVNSTKDPKTRQLPEIPKSALNPTCWAVLSEERNTCCLVACERELYRLRQGDNLCAMCSVSFESNYKSIIMMSVSYNHSFIALYTDNGVVWMGTSNLQTKCCEFQTNRSERPTQIEWILDMEDNMKYEAIAIAYPSLLLIVSITGHSTEYTYDSVAFLIPENDCVRILSIDTHEVVEKVPKHINNIFTYNSQQPSGWLYYAHQKYEAKNHESDEVLGLIANQLPEAVDECIEAAGYVFNTIIQKNLIRSAFFGKGFIVGHNPEKYIKMCRILRVLNALRDPEIGIPLTYSQFNQLQPNVILDRLVFRKHYGLAIQIAKHLKLPESRILEHWAFHKVMHDDNDDQVVRKISEKLRMAGGQGISICNIAKKAGDRNRKELAIRLLELEPRPSLQVPLLLTLGESKRALMSATKSGDTDLIYTVLLQLKAATPLADFQMMVRTFPVAQNLYKKYCNLNSKTALQEIFNQEDDFVAQAEFSLQDGIANSNIESALLTASVAYKKAHKDIEWELCEDARKLLKSQKTFAEKYSTSSTQSFNGLSLHQTLKRLLTLGDIKHAERMKAEYKVSDKRFWWLRIQVLADSFQWEELEKFSKSKKSPIGYEPFVEVCLKKHKVDEAKKYLPKCRAEKKVKLYIRAGLVEEAAQTCFEQRDLHNLYTVHMNAAKTNNRALVSKIESLIQKLSEK